MSALENLAPRTFPASDYAVGREKIAEYAAAVGETNPLHLDLEHARAAGHADLVAPPMFAVVFQGKAIWPALSDPSAGIDFAHLLHGAQAFTWGPLVIAGDQITTAVTLAQAYERAGLQFFVFEASSRNQRDELVVTGTWTNIVRPRRPRDERPAADPAPPQPGDDFALRLTPDKYTAVRYAGASGDFNPIHVDPEFARSVGLPGAILHGLWTMAQVARAHTEAFGGPQTLASLSVQFRGMAVAEQEIVVRGTVGEPDGDLIPVTSEAAQGSNRLVRNGRAEIRR